MTLATGTRPTTRTAKPKPAITRTRYHQYIYGGVTYPGVTGIIKVLDKSDVLMRWAAKNTAEAAVALGPELAKMQATIGVNGTVSALTQRSAWKNDEARDMGSIIHEHADRLAKGEPSTVIEPAVRKRVENYADWLASSGWRIRLSEAYILNETLGYGGTLDLLAYDEEGLTVLADVKTGKGVYGETKLQLMAYSDAEWVCPPESTKVYPMPRVDRHVVLHVTDEGVRVIELDLTNDDRAAFVACMTLSPWHKANKDRL